MPREILFRGKLLGGGEWSYGNLLVKSSGVAIIAPDDTPLGKYGQIDPATVGQYTGLTDKNGKMIFEGDIVREYAENSENEYDYDFFDYGRVFWYQQQSRFLRTSKLFPDDCAQIAEHREYEVIGNIYDNPEILEAAKP